MLFRSERERVPRSSAYLLVVGTSPEVVWVAGDEVTVAERFRVGVELVARGTD